MAREKHPACASELHTELLAHGADRRGVDQRCNLRYVVNDELVVQSLVSVVQALQEQVGAHGIWFSSYL